jgi:hypothetical protein
MNLKSLCTAIAQPACGLRGICAAIVPASRVLREAYGVRAACCRFRECIGHSLFLHALERTKALGFRELEIESDPNAEGFYRRLGARRVGVSIHAVERQQRELPVLIYEVDQGLTPEVRQ